MMVGLYPLCGRLMGFSSTVAATRAMHSEAKRALCKFARFEEHRKNARAAQMVKFIGTGAANLGSGALNLGASALSSGALKFGTGAVNLGASAVDIGTGAMNRVTRGISERAANPGRPSASRVAPGLETNHDAFAASALGVPVGLASGIE